MTAPQRDPGGTTRPLVSDGVAAAAPSRLAEVQRSSRAIGVVGYCLPLPMPIYLQSVRCEPHGAAAISLPLPRFQVKTVGRVMPEGLDLLRPAARLNQEADLAIGSASVRYLAGVARPATSAPVISLDASCTDLETCTRIRPPRDIVKSTLR